MKQLNRIFSIFVTASMLVAMALTAQPVTQARAATFTVTKTADTADGTCDSDCSLREAITDANNNGAGSDTITVPAGTYTLTFGDQLPVVTSAIIINGTSPVDILANASSNTASYRVFEVANNGGAGNLTLNSINVKNGNCINANSCSSQDNTGSNGQGGGIFNGGILTLNNSFLSGNRSANGGGGVYNYAGTLTVTSTSFFSNIAGGDGGGIGINNGTVTVTSSNFVTNTALSGGGIASGGILNVTGSLFSTNTVTGDGGGIGGGGKLSVKTSSFHDNSASRGGGLSNSGGGPNNVSNNTFYNNSASSKGGGMFNYEDLNLTNNTFSGNSAPSGGAFYSDPYQHENDPRFAVVTLKNNILANSTSGGDCFNYVNGTAKPVTGNNNLIETEGSSPCGTTAPIASDPNLGTLTGFPLPQFYPLNTGSPALDKGDDAACAASPVNNTSQNGVTRPQGAHCDIGSFELTSSGSTFTLTVVKAGNGTGTVTSSPVGIACGTTCSFAFNSGTVVTLTAVPDAGFPFSGWSGGGCSGTGTCVVTMDAVKSVTATFGTAATSAKLSVFKAGNGTGTVTSAPAGIACGTTCSFSFNIGTVVTLTAVPDAGFPFSGWTGGGCSGTGTCVITMDAAKSVTATFGTITQIFTDVPPTHPHYKYIQALFTAGLTSGCSTNPMKFCPDNILDRAQSAVFMVRGQFGSTFVLPPEPWNTFLADDWSQFLWAKGWAEAMFLAGLTKGCSTNPLKFCPANQLPRVEASVFGLKMKYGESYVPPKATGTVFGDFPSTNPSYWGIDWAEQAYKDGLLLSCGTDATSGKPMFCPNVLVNRGWAAFMIVTAKGVPTP